VYTVPTGELAHAGVPVGPRTGRWRALPQWSLAALVAIVLTAPLVQIIRGGERLTILPNLEVDSRSYDSIALDLARRRSPDAISPVFPPGFVAVIALVYTVCGHSLVAAKTVLWLCLVATTILAAFLAWRVHGTRVAAWTAALLAASSPALQAYTGTLQFEVLVAALVVALLVLAVNALDRGRGTVLLGRSAALGAVLGVALLTRESLIALVPVFGVFAACRAGRRASIATAAAAALIVVAASLAPSLAWSAFQSRRVGHAMLIRDNVSGILPYGHNPNANGTYNVALAGVGEPSGIPFMLAEPGRELWLAGRKVMYFWGVLRDGWNVPRPMAVWAARATGGIVPLEVILPWTRGGWLLAAFLIACATFGRQRWREFWVLPATVVALMAVHVATIASHRFAVPVLPVVFVMIAGPIARLLGRLTPASIIVLALLASIAWGMQAGEWPIRYRLQPTELDGVNAENRVEADGRMVRFSDARRGRRVAFALYDEYLPKGPLVLRMQTRRGPGELPPGSPLARVRMFTLGQPPCETFVTSVQLPAADAWTPLTIGCTLPDDGPARLIVETLGRADLSFSSVLLQWQRR
jgi:4-amino-4-deoxy-L-arabinose transferase-like glycosyltransferase